MKENISRPVPQNNLESVKEKYDETTNAKIDNFVTATDGPAKQNEELSNAETLLNDKVEYFRASTKSIDTNDFQHEAKGHDLQVDVDVKKKDNDDNKTAEPNVDSDLKTNDTDSEVNKDNGIGAGHPDPKEGGSAGFEDVERKSDINNENLQIKDDVEGDIQTNENSDIKFLERIRSVVEDDAGSANKENGETVDAKIENLEIDGSAKHNKKLSESKSLADKMEDISVSIKSLEIKGLQHEADDVESAVDMTKKDYDRNEGAGLNVESDIKTSNTDMETKRNGDITVGQTSSGGEGDAGFEDVERKVDIHDENLQIKQEGKKKSNDIEIEVKIKEDGDISAVQSHSGKDEAINMDLKADAKQKEIGSDKRETDINSEAVKINVNKEMKSKSTVNVGSLREDENAELVKENDVNDEIVDEQNRKVDEGKYIQGTLKKKDIQESNIEEVIELEGRKALSASIVQTTKIDIDEIANQPQQTVSINIPNVETAKIPEQLNRHEQQNAPATDIDESLRRDFNKYLEKTINDAESLKILKTEVMEPENDQKRVAESRTDRRKIEESADIGGSKIEITEEDIKSSSHLKEIPSKVSELIIEDTSKNSDNTKIVIYRDAPNSGIAETTLRHIEDDSGSAEDGKPNVEVIKEVKTDSLKNEAKENNGSEAKSQLISNWKVEDDSHVKEKKYDDAKYIDSSKENTAQQCADDKINESNVKNLLDSKPDFYRSDTVVEPLLVKKNVPHLSDDTTDSNNNTSKEETPLEEGIRAAVSQIVKPIDVESLLKTLPEVPTHDLPPTEDDLSSFGSTDSVVTVIMKPKQEIAPRTLPSRTFSTSALEDRVELLDQVQNSLLDQLSGKSKFDIDQLRKELHDATLYKEESPPDAEVLEYVYDFDPEDDPEYERVARTPLRELPDIAEEDDVPETSGGLTNEIVISNDSIEIGKEHQRLLHTGELHDSVLVANGQSLWAGSESRNRLKHTSEFHDTVVVPLPSGADVKITNASKTAVTEATGAKQDRNESGGTEHDRRDSGNQTSDQQPPAGAEAVTSRDVGGAAQAALKDAAPAGPESTRPAQSPARTVNEAMESENNNNKRNNAIATNVPERNMEAQAATKIQAGFRGYQVRKQLKAKNTALDQKRQLRKRTSRDNLKNPDLEEKSAVKIQAGVRGFLVRRRQKKQASNSSASA
ncbi:uncharacterized protein [Euwallacea similis]|uniref:uncharacterized protein n=1 Tax=Euwallacea similis TaxID=1736056 RepID=UPI00344D26DC